MLFNLSEPHLPHLPTEGITLGRLLTGQVRQVSRGYRKEQAGDPVLLTDACEVCLMQPCAESVVNMSSSPSLVVITAVRGGW